MSVRWDSGVCMLPTGNCSHHGSVEGGGGEGEGWGRPSRTINRKLKGSGGRSHQGIQDEGTFTRTMCTSTVIYKYSSPSSFQLSENKQTNKKMSGTIQRSNNTAGRMEQVRVGAASLGPLRARSCTYIQGPSASEDSRAHANHLPPPPPRLARRADTHPFQCTRCR